MQNEATAAILGAVVGFLTTDAAALAMGLIVLFVGTRFVKNISDTSPLRDHAGSLAGLVFIVPLLIVTFVSIDAESEAVTGFMGTIVGYFFGTNRNSVAVSDSTKG
jgi:hypothetical protein